MAEYPVDSELPTDKIDVRYYVSHTPQGQQVIVKEFLCADMTDVAGHIREGVVAAEIAHPNICKMLTIIPLLDGQQYRVKIVLEFIQTTLMKEIEERRARDQGYYSEEELRDFLRKMASALQFAHSKSIAHRDINPEHVYITPGGEYKLSDFGVAWRGADQKPLSQTLTGQLTYMCPKMKGAVVEGKKTVPGGFDAYKADVYSLGVTLIFMAKLFPPNTLMSLNRHEANVERLLTDIVGLEHVSPQFLEIIRNMVHVEESDRFDINNVLEALSQPNLQTTLFALTSTQLHTFDFDSDSWKTKALSGDSLSVNEHSATTALNTETLFCCCGGNRPCKFHTDNKAYVVTVEGATRVEADMRVGRLRPGIVYHNDSASVFVFGGAEDGGAPMRTALKYSFPKPEHFMARNRPTGAWDSLPDMTQPRFAFNPCVFAGYIYIAGGGHPSIEAYNPATGRPKPIPQRENVDPDIRVMVVHMDKLVMIGGARVFRRSHSEGRTVEERARQSGPADWSNIAPVVAENAVYTVVMTNQGITLLKLGVFTGKVLTERRLS